MRKIIEMKKVNSRRFVVSEARHKAFTPNDKSLSKKKYFRTGFTLIEMLVVLIIFSTIGLALFSTFSSGINIWQRLTQATDYDDVNIFLERLARELRNTFDFTAVKFQGEEEKICFAAFVILPSAKPGEQPDFSIGQVTYEYDNLAKQIVREEKSLSQIFQEHSGQIRELSAGIHSLEFIYYHYDLEQGEYIWISEWGKEGLPLAVRIELEFGDEGQSEKITRTIDIPVTQS